MKLKTVVSLFLFCFLAEPLHANPEAAEPAESASPDLTGPPVQEKAPAKSEPEAPSGSDNKIFNRLKWSTASELNNFGYLIFRSTSKDGEFKQVNTEPILGAGTTDEVTQYEFLDESIEPETEYFYYIESWSMDGVKKRFSPIIKAPPKTLQPTTEESDDPKETVQEEANPTNISVKNDNVKEKQ